MMMQLYATELQKAEKRMRALATMPVKSRVAEALFVLRQVFGADTQGYCRIPVTRIDIASYAGTTYEAVFRLLTAWTREGLVTTTGKKIRIDEKEKLTALIQPSTL
jgi:CRP/FNR family transcriptional regulator